MADVITGVTEVDATIQEVVSSLIQQQLIAHAGLTPTISDFSAMAQPGLDLIKIPRAGDFTVNDKSENTAVDAQSLTYATDDLPMDKHKVIQVLVEDIAAIQANIPLMQDFVGRMARGMAKQVDLDIIAEFEAGVSTAAPDHKIAYDNATDMGKVDVLNGRNLLCDQNVDLGNLWLGVSCANEKALLSVDDFVQADKYGDSRGLVAGELGTLYGVRVIVSSLFEDLKSFMWHPEAQAYGSQRSARFESHRDLPNLADRASIDMIYGVKTLDAGKRHVWLGTA